MAILYNELNANNFSIVELAENPSPSSAVRRDFVIKQVAELRDLISSLSSRISGNSNNIKPPCAIAITSHFNLAVGGSPTLQGVSIVPNTRVLLTSQQNPAENGLYIARTGPWIRAFDCNDPSDFSYGLTVEVLGGDLENRGYWMLTSPDPIILDQSPLIFQKQSGFNPGGVIPISSGGTGGTTPETARKNLGAAEELVFSPLGDGQTSVFVITHGLENSKILEPSVIDLGTSKYVQASSRILDANNIEVAFGRPPAAGSIAITIVGVRYSN